MAFVSRPGLISSFTGPIDGTPRMRVPNARTVRFRAVIWGSKGEIQGLPPLPGDNTSAATAINDKGQVVGISGACGIAVGGVSALHAVIWNNGVPTNIGDLGGHTWNTTTAIK